MNNLKSRLKRRLGSLKLDINESCEWRKIGHPTRIIGRTPGIRDTRFIYPIPFHSVLDIMKIDNYRGRF